MRNLFNSFVAFISFLTFLQAQDPSGCKAFIRFKNAQNSVIQDFRANPLTLNYDVKYHRLEVEVDPAVNYIKGKVTTYFSPTEVGFQQLNFDFVNSMTVKSVSYHGATLNYVQNGNDNLQIDFPKIIEKGILDSLVVQYEGIPPTEGFGSFEQNTHNGTPIIWTLSEPYGAKTWWPCKQDLNDKIENIDIVITHPKEYKAASNGMLVSTKIEGDKMVSFWQHKYPIAAYLVCFAVTNYEVYEIKVPYKQDTTRMINYIYPESLQGATVGLNDNAKHLQFFNEIFGIYPFQNEKYGHAQFGWGGGMEHQTMTFVGSFGFELLAHELAHHWFGDKVTCGSWQDIWLNEGFATYCSGLCYERLLPQYWTQFKQGRINSITSTPDGSVLCTDTTSVGRIFDGRLSYAKGAMVLHMLRWKLGDADFFQGVRNYLTNRAYNYATTKHLKAELEKQSKTDLTEFFKDWFAGQGFPSYGVNWSPLSDGIRIQLNQTTSHNSVLFFEMPVPIQVSGEGKDTILRLDHTFSGQVFDIKLPFKVKVVRFDPEFWLISANNTVNQSVSNEEVEAIAQKIAIAPNPIKDVLMISSTLEQPIQEIKITDAQGKIIYSSTILNENNLKIDTNTWQSGFYTATFHVNGVKISKKIVK
jgi:aminopeptidase N